MSDVRLLRLPLTVRAGDYPMSVKLFQRLEANAVDFDLVHAQNNHTLMSHTAMRTKLSFVYTPHYQGSGHNSAPGNAAPYGHRSIGG